MRKLFWKLLIMAFFVCIPVVFAQGQKQQALDQIGVDRARFVEGLVARWSSLTVDNGMELRSGLIGLSDARLAEASGAKTMEALNKSISGPDTLGNQSNDLVFNKVTPCRIIDTRVVGGILTAGVPRSFDANGPFNSQGGDPGNCGLPSGEPAALVLTIVAVNPAGNGNIRAYPKDVAVPTAVAINYSSGLNLANTTIVPLKQDVGDPLEFTISANVSNSHVVVDVVGYFWAPSATPLECGQNFTFTSVPHGNTWNATSPACTVGRVLTGGGVEILNCTQNVSVTRNSPDATSTLWQTQGFNGCGITIAVRTFHVCCATPEPNEPE